MTKLQTQSAQNTTEQTPKPTPLSSKSDTKPDFSHRVNSYHEGVYSLEDATYHAVEQALAVINHIQQQFTGESSRLNDDLNFYALEAASNSILDVKAIIAHYAKNQANLQKHQA